MSRFTELQKKHEKLLLEQIAKRISKSEVEEFIKEITASGGLISSVRERDQMRANLRYWANYTYEETGIYPDVELNPSNTTAIPSAITIAVILGLITLLGSIGSKVWGSYLVNITPVVTSTLFYTSINPYSGMLCSAS